jgi:hypothetical protein
MPMAMPGAISLMAMSLGMLRNAGGNNPPRSNWMAPEGTARHAKHSSFGQVTTASSR